MMRRRNGLWLLALLLGIQEGAHAESVPEPTAVPAANGEDMLVPLRRAVRLAEDRFSGTVIEAEVKAGQPREETPLVYELRLLTEAGHILRIRLDALNGGFLEAEGRGLQGARRAQ